MSSPASARLATCLLFALLPCSASGSPETGRPALLETPTERCLALGDLNGDNAPDMVMLSRGRANDLYLVLQQENQLCRSSGRLCPGLAGHAAVTARATVWDANNDGLPDVILVNAALQPVAQFFNRGVRNGEWQGLAEAEPHGAAAAAKLP